MAARAQRREARDQARAAERARAFAESALAHGPDEQARMAAVAEPSDVVLPVPRFLLLTDAEYEETRRWWKRLENPSAARGLAIRIRREIRDAAREHRAATRAAAVWRLEQRAFERAQGRDGLANRDSRPARKAANHWVAIDEDRALKIAIAALEKSRPPQGRK